MIAVEINIIIKMNYLQLEIRINIKEKHQTGFYISLFKNFDNILKVVTKL